MNRGIELGLQNSLTVHETCVAIFLPAIGPRRRAFDNSRLSVEGIRISEGYHHRYHLSLNRDGRWGITDDFTTRLDISGRNKIRRIASMILYCHSMFKEVFLLFVLVFKE